MAKRVAQLPEDELIVPDHELKAILALANEGARGDGISRFVLDALKAATEKALGRQAVKERDFISSRDWKPRKDQMWKNGDRTRDDRRITAWSVFEKAYQNIPYSERPYAHQVRQHPDTRELYRALCVWVSRNKSRGQEPSSIAQLFPVSREARGGLLFDPLLKRNRD